jgi:predicted lysophospholipase L1 biosynthesis ABC-type transport system permease subunit
MSEHQKTTQAILSTQAEFKEHQTIERFALFNSNGTPVTGRNSKIAAYTAAGAIGTAAKTVAEAEPSANTMVPIRFTSGNTAAAPTVSFNGGTARAVNLGGSTPTGAEITLAANGVAMFWFDGTILHQLGVYS